MHFENISSLSSHSFHIVIQSADIWNFDKVQLINYFFWDSTFGVISKKASLYIRLSRVSSRLSSKNFIVFSFYIYVCDPFGVHFCDQCKICVYRVFFLYLHVDVQLFCTIFWKDNLCFTVLPLLLCERRVDTFVGLFLGYLIWSMDLLLHQYTLSWLL